MLTFVVTRGTDCEPQVDRVERVRREVPDVDFVDRRQRRLATRRRASSPSSAAGRSPSAVDEDGAVVNLYGVGVCPITVFAQRRRGAPTELGNLTEEQLRRRAQRLVG